MMMILVRVHHLLKIFIYNGTFSFFLVLLLYCPSSSTSFSIPTPPNKTSTNSVTSTSSPPSSPSQSSPPLVHTLILCRHGDSIWNGGQPGTQETFTGWTDVPLSEKGLVEAKNTANELSSSMLSGYTYGSGGAVNGLDACFTSILGRARQTAHYCCWAFADMPRSLSLEPQKYVSDWRLNERHYGNLQGYVKADVENGLYGHDPVDVEQWRRGWHAIPPLLDEDDPRRIEEVRKFANYCGGKQNVPRGESLEMVARDRIRPFLDEVLHPTLEEAASLRISATNKKSECDSQNDRDRDQYSGEDDIQKDINMIGQNGGQTGGGAGLVVAHANSLRALIGVICDVEKDPIALKRLEAMKIQTGVPLILKYMKLQDGKYRACDLMLEVPTSSQQLPTRVPNGGSQGSRDLPIWPLSSIPTRRGNSNAWQIQRDLQPGFQEISSSYPISEQIIGNNHIHHRMGNLQRKNQQPKRKRQPTIRIDVI